MRDRDCTVEDDESVSASLLIAVVLIAVLANVLAQAVVEIVPRHDDHCREEKKIARVAESTKPFGVRG